jgi:cytochrome c oxidase assembly protein subunit 15
LPQAALVAIHWSHRMFALAVVAAVAWAATQAFRVSRRLGTAIALLLAVQFSLGVANVAFNLPLALAAAHNAGAAALLVALVVLNFFAFREHTGSSP